MSISVVPSNLRFTLVVFWIFYIMGLQQCLLIYSNVRVARSSVLQNTRRCDRPT